MGFWVAKTVKSGDSAWVSRSMVTARSCMAWSSALWVLAGARLISSASKNVVNTGPLTRLNALRWKSKMFVPVMSAGMRSGVNWMRLESVPRTCARVRTNKVLATPGTPSMRACWPVKTAMSAWSTASRWPMMTLPTSARAAARRLLSWSRLSMPQASARNASIFASIAAASFFHDRPASSRRPRSISPAPVEVSASRHAATNSSCVPATRTSPP